MPYSDQAKLAEIEREITMRERVYPRLVAKGAMRAAEAPYLIAIMRAVADDYRARIRGEA